MTGHNTADSRSGDIDSMRRVFIWLGGSFAEPGLPILRSSVKSGMENVRAKGRPIGRPKKAGDGIPPALYKHCPVLLSEQMHAREPAGRAGCQN